MGPVEQGGLAEARFARGVELGRGAHAKVYRSFDRELARDVALKAFEGGTGEVLLALKNEFRRLRGVVHPNLVQLYDLVVTADEAFFTMELLEGPLDVVRYVRGGLTGGAALDTTGVDRLRATFAQVVDGLAALHGAGLVHRDLKPSNVVVVPGGRAVLLDFGLTDRQDRDGASGRGEFAGTPAYTAPEVFRGQGATPASDVYSLGILLAEALTGREPVPALGAAAGRTARELEGEEFRGRLPEDLVDLTTALMNPEPELRPSLETVRKVIEKRAAGAVVSHAVNEVPFVGRSLELEWLGEQLRAARAGGTVVAVVHGESGIGKTELVRRFFETESDVLVLSGHCRPRESVPYNALDGPTDQLSAELLHIGDVAGLSSEAADAMLKLFPVLERVPFLLARRGGGSALSPREATRVAFAGLADVLRLLGAARPIAMWIDDAQWGDQDSAYALREILDQRIPRFLLLMTCRPRRDEGIVGSLLETNVAATSIELGPLGENESRELAGRLLSGRASDAEVAAVTRRSEGSPFVLQEIANQIGSDGDTALDVDIAPATLARVDGVGSGAGSIARVVALAGSGLHVQEILGLADPGANESLLYRMQELRLLRPGASRSSGLEIYHDRIRDAVMESISPDDRSALHRRIAAALCRRDKPDAAMLVDHYLGCAEPEQASHWAVLAAEEADRGFAFARAAELYGQALDLRARGAEDWALSARFGQALAFAGDRVRGGKIIGQAAEACEDRDEGRAEVLRLRADAARELLCGGDVGGGLDALSRMVRAAGFRYPRTPRGALMELLFVRVLLGLRGLEFRERREADIPAERLERIDACWTGIIGLNSFDAVRSGMFQARHTLLSLSAGEPKRVARALTLEAAFRSVEGGHSGRGKAWELLARVDALARRLDDPRTTAFANLCSSVAHYFASQWEPAFEHASAGESVFSRMHGSGWERSMCRMYRLWSSAWSGNIVTLRQEQSAALQTAAASEDWLDGIIAASGHANLTWLFDDDPAEARRRATSVIGRFPEIGFQSPHYADLVAQTRIDLYEGTSWRAWERIEAAWPRLRAAQLLRLQLFRIELRHLRACAAIAAARSRPTQSSVSNRWTTRRLLRLAAAEAGRLRREKLAVADGLAATIEAALSDSESERRRLLDTAVVSLSTTGAKLFAAIAGAIALDTTDAIDAVGKAFTIRDPKRIARFVVPAGD